jgi:hypothetical protein
MPSPYSVKANGVDLGNTQVALVKKIEELTLYLIRQNEILHQKDLQLAVQDQKLQELADRISRLEKGK